MNLGCPSRPVRRSQPLAGRRPTRPGALRLPKRPTGPRDSPNSGISRRSVVLCVIQGRLLERVSAGPGRPSARLLRPRGLSPSASAVLGHARPLLCQGYGEPFTPGFRRRKKKLASWLDGVLYVVILRVWLVDFAVGVPPPTWSAAGGLCIFWTIYVGRF